VPYAGTKQGKGKEQEKAGKVVRKRDAFTHKHGGWGIFS
jgi:hypothetical protein